MSADTIHRSRPLTVEDEGVVTIHGGKVLRKWKVRMEDGTAGTCWTPDATDTGERCPCPFVEGRRCAYRIDTSKGYTKLLPYDVTEFDRQRIISRQACLNSAASLISAGCGEATVENMTGLAELLFRWVNE